MDRLAPRAEALHRVSTKPCGFSSCLTCPLPQRRSAAATRSSEHTSSARGSSVCNIRSTPGTLNRKKQRPHAGGGSKTVYLRQEECECCTSPNGSSQRWRSSSEKGRKSRSNRPINSFFSDACYFGSLLMAAGCVTRSVSERRLAAFHSSVSSGVLSATVYLSDGWPHSTARPMAYSAARIVYLSDGWPHSTAIAERLIDPSQCI